MGISIINPEWPKKLHWGYIHDWLQTTSSKPTLSSGNFWLWSCWNVGTKVGKTSTGNFWLIWNYRTNKPLTVNSFLIILPAMLITWFCMFARSVSTHWSPGATRWSRRMSPSWSRSRCWARGAWSSLSPASRPQSASPPRYEPEEIVFCNSFYCVAAANELVISDEFWWKLSSKEAFQLWRNVIRELFRGGR